MIHLTDKCICPVCKSPEKSIYPVILFAHYDTGRSSVKMLGVFWDGKQWNVSYVVRTPVAGELQEEHKSCSSLDWNVDCQSWRKDLVPKGIAGMGWRKEEDNE